MNVKTKHFNGCVKFLAFPKYGTLQMSPLRGSLVIGWRFLQKCRPAGVQCLVLAPKRLCKVFGIPSSKACQILVEQGDPPIFDLFPLQPRRGGISVEKDQPTPQNPVGVTSTTFDKICTHHKDQFKKKFIEHRRLD